MLSKFRFFDLDGKFISDSGAAVAMGFVAENPRTSPTLFTSCITTSFLLRERSRKRVSQCVACAVLFLIRLSNASGSVLLGTDVREDLRLVVDHVDCNVSE